MRHQRLGMATTAIAAALLQACATPQNPSSDGVALQREEAHIPFVNQRSAIHSFQADGREGLWVEDARHEWYYAKFYSPCFGVDYAITLGFDTGTSDRLDRYSTVIVPRDRERCPIQSFTKSDPPPDGDRHAVESEPDDDK